ncbi:transcriptional regulator GutM [Serratia odorifera]|jgi:glucitol operon activator protein|uniref:Glucitol operon activator protein GutM n=2 Tax=Serratia odorifera TaxID=618 RepID=D4E301_SEROD|nr:transcriptional regulator GutM [Serratia odorifera]EFE95915.1 glucitol operon activator protein GutM [Serratia odorifera DSM 4582]MBJ2066387.1 transcriptional regulator GutM [Serratia odorifera]PNK90463.1 transcriptional regulator GutM [Serratia odorifera]RII71592.1 transcriptional regulator GutM [Serratia odorifera]VDZ59480.1 DNA-binding transcriptional activator GutM [Serratia odorifera]
MTTSLIILAAIAWLGQIALGWWQIQRFNHAFDRLCQLGPVGVGRSGGRFKPRVVLALAFDAQQRVCGSMMMRGLTVFAQPKPLVQLHGLHQHDLLPDVIFPEDRACQTALSLAIKAKS